MSVCHMCDDKGIEGGCPRCGATPRKSVEIKTMHLDIAADIVPTAYQGKLWTRPDEKDIPIKFVEFDKKLEKVCNEFMEGRIPRFSMFIATPPKYGKHAFAYTCIQTALVQKFSVAPMLSTSDWRRLYRVSQMNPFYKLYDKYTWDDLVTRDVVFVTVDNSEDRFDVIPLLKDILDTRARFDRPTFIISDYRVTELSPHWRSGSHGSIYNPMPERDYNRYPVFIHRFD